MKASVLTEMHILTDELAPVDSIKPNNYNPNRQSDEEFLLLIKSIMADGFTDAILVNRETREIIDGEHRWTAAIVLNHLIKTGQAVTLEAINTWRHRRGEIIDSDLKLPIKILDKDEIQRRVATQRHNKARGHDDIDLLSGMFRELEAMGGLGLATSALEMSNEEVDRLLAYGDSILDHFPSDEPSLAWEPRQTEPGMVESWVDAENRVTQSVSRAASTPETRIEYANSAVPGMASGPSMSGDSGQATPPKMARRIYVFLEEEAHIVDKVLGKEAASELVRICKQKAGIS